MGTGAKIAVVAGVIGGGALAAYLLTRGTGTASGAIPVSFCFLSANGVCSTSPGYTTGEAMLANVTVPANSNPVSVQAFVGGVAGSIQAWSFPSPTYQYDFGGAPSISETIPVYVKVDFSDGTSSTSNTVQVSVLALPTPTFAEITVEGPVINSVPPVLPVNVTVTGPGASETPTSAVFTWYSLGGPVYQQTFRNLPTNNIPGAPTVYGFDITMPMARGPYTVTVTLTYPNASPVPVTSPPVSVA